MWCCGDSQDVGLEAAIIERKRNSSLVKRHCAENVTGLKHITEATDRCGATEALNPNIEILNKCKIQMTQMQNGFTRSVDTRICLGFSVLSLGFPLLCSGGRGAFCRPVKVCCEACWRWQKRVCRHK